MEDSQLTIDIPAETHSRPEEPDNTELLAKDLGIANISQELIDRYKNAADSSDDQVASAVSSTLFDQAHRAINIVKHNMGAVFSQIPPFPRSVSFYHNKHSGKNGGVSPIVDGRSKGVINAKTLFPKDTLWGQIDYTIGDSDVETITLQLCDRKLWKKVELTKQGSQVTASYKEAPDPE
jgi:hypothetical protein